MKAAEIFDKGLYVFDKAEPLGMLIPYGMGCLIFKAAQALKFINSVRLKQLRETVTTDEDIMRLVCLKSKFEFAYPDASTPDAKHEEYGYVKEKDFDDAMEMI